MMTEDAPLRGRIWIIGRGMWNASMEMAGVARRAQVLPVLGRWIVKSSSRGGVERAFAI
jgi:hypothetical protein